MNLGTIHIDKPVALAPLAGWTDQAFRMICKEFDADIVVTEMASVDGLIRDHEKTFQLISFSDLERPIGLQLFGTEPETFASSIQKISHYKPDFIDINFGCPAKKIIKRGAGSALMRNLDDMAEIIRAIKNETDIPVSAKIRSGWNSDIAVEAAQVLVDAGVSFLTIHPRTQSMQFKGEADWSIIEKLKKSVSVPVIGNGDIKNAGDALRMLEQTGCDGIMVGRAARGNPWIFRQIKDFIKFGIPPEPVSSGEKIDVCLKHYRYARDFYGDKIASHIMRKHMACYIKGLEHATELRRQIFLTYDYSEIEEKLLTCKNLLGTENINKQELNEAV